MSLAVYPLSKPKRLRAMCVAMIVLAVASVIGLAHPSWGYRLIFALLLGIWSVWRLHRWWQLFPLELMVQDGQVALRHPHAQSEGHWQRALVGNGYIAVRSAHGFWLIPRESVASVHWHDLRLSLIRH